MLSILSDATKEAEQWRKRVEAFPEGIDKAVGNNAKLVLKGSIEMIDDLIYSTPEGPTYQRTKNLRRANKIERLAPMSWLVYNDAEYAGFVHDGTTTMPARPWMGNSVDANEVQMRQNLEDAGIEVLGGGDVRVDEIPETGGDPEGGSGGAA